MRDYRCRRLLARPTRRAACFILSAVLPRARDDFADAAHRLRITAHHSNRAEIVENVLRRNRLAADAALRERDVLRQIRIEVMTHHQHVEMLVDGVDRVRPRRVRGTRQHIRLAAYANNVRRVSAASAFAVIV
jgi:hypothetical protein